MKGVRALDYKMRIDMERANKANTMTFNIYAWTLGRANHIQTCEIAFLVVSNSNELIIY